MSVVFFPISSELAATSRPHDDAGLADSRKLGLSRLFVGSATVVRLRENALGSRWSASGFVESAHLIQPCDEASCVMHLVLSGACYERGGWLVV